MNATDRPDYGVSSTARGPRPAPSRTRAPKFSLTQRDAPRLRDAPAPSARRPPRRPPPLAAQPEDAHGRISREAARGTRFTLHSSPPARSSLADRGHSASSPNTVCVARHHRRQLQSHAMAATPASPLARIASATRIAAPRTPLFASFAARPSTHACGGEAMQGKSTARSVSLDLSASTTTRNKPREERLSH